MKDTGAPPCGRSEAEDGRARRPTTPPRGCTAGRAGRSRWRTLTSKVPKDGQKSLAKGLERVQQEVKRGVDPYPAHVQL